MQNIISEAGGGKYDEQAKILEKFLLNLNTKTSRGIPVGPAASIVLAEAIMADIDKKILNYSNDFVRWVDDIIIYFTNKHEAVYVFHELTKYLYSSHRLVFSGEKSHVYSVKKFLKHHFKDEESYEEIEILKNTEKLAQEKFEELDFDFDISPYQIYHSDVEEALEEEYEKIYNEIIVKEQFKILSNAYKNILEKSISSKNIDIPLLRRIFRNATKYRIRSILTLTLKNFEFLIPIIREVVIYLNKVINDKTITVNEKHFKKILASECMKIPFINIWVSYLLQNNHFNKIDLPINYNNIIHIRDKTLIARRRKDTIFIKDYKDGLDVLGPWDKRAILFSADILSKDEMEHWIKHVSVGGDIIDKSICVSLLSK